MIRVTLRTQLRELYMALQPQRHLRHDRMTMVIMALVPMSLLVAWINGQGMAFPVERSTPTTQAATERENNQPPKLAAVDSESAPAPVAAEVDGGPEDEPPPNVPRIGGKPALKVVK